MPKGAKTSASSATRKKHQRKAGKEEDDAPPPRPKQRGQKKGQDGKKLTKAERKQLAKVKTYIPPPKPPAPPIPDPLDGQGLARTLPAELVVVLRRLGKKDDVTRRKGLDELKEQWVAPILQAGGGDEEELQRELAAASVEAALPVWLHNLASLLQSPSHRAQALALHDDLLSIPAFRGVILDGMALAYLPGTQDRDILGSLLVASLEEGRRGGRAMKMWDEIVRFGLPPQVEGEEEPYTRHIDIIPQLPALAEYLSLSILDPMTLHRDIHPAPVQAAFSAPTPPPAKAKGKQAAKMRPSPVPTPTPPPEEDTEVAEERWARYRVGGLVGLAWLVSRLPGAGYQRPPEEVLALLNNPVLWSALGTTCHIADITPIGTQPPIRRAAYNLLASLIDAYPEEVSQAPLLQLLSATVLGNCWNEKEAVVWEAAGPAVVKFLTKYRQAWELSSKIEDDGDDDDGGDEDEDDDEDEMETEPPSRAETATPPSEETSPDAAVASQASSRAFDSLLDFVSTICPAVPHLTYPLLVVVISTIPSALLPLSSPPSLPLQNLFSHLWSPVDARLLSTHTLGNQSSAFQSFFQSACDISAYLVERAEGDAKVWLAKEQLGSRAWGDGVAAMGGKGGRRGGPVVETEAKIVSKAVDKAATISPELSSLVMEEVERTSVEACFPSEGQSAFLPRALNALTKLRESCPSVAERVDAIILKIAGVCTERLFHHVEESSQSATPQAETLIAILTARKDLFPPERVEVLSQGLQAHMAELVVSLSPAVVASLFDATVAVSGDSERGSLLASLWAYIDSREIDQNTRFALVAGILESKSTSLISECRLDAIAAEATRSALADQSAPGLFIASSAVTSKGWMSDDARATILSSVCSSVQDAVDGLLTAGSEASVPTPALSVLASYTEGDIEALVTSDEYIHAVVALHHLVVLVPKLGLNVTVPASATKAWAATASLPGDSKSKLSVSVSRSLAELLGRVSCRADPDTLVDVALMTDLGELPTPASVTKTMLPPAEEMLSHLSRHTSQPPHPALPVVDPLVHCVGDAERPTSRASDFDASGRSRAARYAEAALALLRADRGLVLSFPHLIHVALFAMILAGDGVAIPGASRGMYTPDAATSNLEQVMRDAEGALSFSLSLVDEAPLAWHKATVEQLKAGDASPTADYLQRLLSDLLAEVNAKSSDVAPRVFYGVLARHLRKSGAGPTEAEVWLNYAMTASAKQPEIAQAVMLAIKPLMLDTKAFETAQNRLANALTGISVKDANERGLPAMRLLIAAAPPADSTSVFLPQQRAIFVLRHVGGWLTAEDDAADELSEEVDVRVAELYAALAPIVQDLSGAHWDTIFELIEGALGSCSLDDPVSYPLLYNALVLLQEVRDLCQTNKALRASWVGEGETKHKDAHLRLVVQLFLQCRDADSEPLQLIHALLLDLLHDASDSVMAEASLPQLCDLLRLSSSSAVQSTAYRLLSQVIKQRTLALVLEVEATVANEPEAPQKTIAFPSELVAIIEAGKDVDWHTDASVSVVMAQLLAWMAIMDHFDDASRTLRWAYLDQLNSSRLLEDALLPFLFAILGVSEVGAWNFPASAYAVDEFFPDLLEPESLPDLNPLASHVYYRALVTIPSAMRAYYESLKDRQLSLSLLAFTSRHYSPVIIQHEFAALREPGAMAALTDEGLSVRIAQGGGAAVAGAGAAEAIASYVVDEQPMEIGIRLPAEFPLKAVDVRDLRRVGVPENKWRGWLMSVQQTITSRNGLILEALTVFKKNVALHFEGVVECAICYSIISLTDRTLPTKPCRTCKNRFHASCLFKWFNSSHSSSCPMCRSLF